MKPVLLSEHYGSPSLPSPDTSAENRVSPHPSGSGEDELRKRHEKLGQQEGDGASSSHHSEYTCTSSSSVSMPICPPKDPPLRSSNALSHCHPDHAGCIPHGTTSTPHSGSPSAASNSSSASSFTVEDRRHAEEEWTPGSSGIRCDGWNLWEDHLPQSISEAKIRQCIFCIGNGVVSVRGYLEESPVIQGGTEPYGSNSMALSSVSHSLPHPSSYAYHPYNPPPLHVAAAPAARHGHPSSGPTAGGGVGSAAPILSYSSSSFSSIAKGMTGGGGGTGEIQAPNSSNHSVTGHPSSDRILHSPPSSTVGETFGYSQGPFCNTASHQSYPHHNRHSSSAGSGQPPPCPNGASMARLPRGIFVAGFTEQWIHQEVGWLSSSISTKESLLVPAPDPFCVHVIVGGELVSTTTGRVLRHTRHLNLATGELFRVMEWESSQHQRRVRIESSRILSCANKNIGVMRFTVYAQKTYNTDIRIVSMNTVHGDPSAPEVCPIENTTDYTDMTDAGSVVVARTKNSCRRVAVATFEKCVWTTEGEALKVAAARANAAANVATRSAPNTVGATLQTGSKSHRSPPAPSVLYRQQHPVRTHKLYQDPSIAGASSSKQGRQSFSHFHSSVAPSSSLLHTGGGGISAPASNSLASSRFHPQLSSSLPPGHPLPSSNSSSSFQPAAESRSAVGEGNEETEMRGERKGKQVESLAPLVDYSSQCTLHHLTPFREGEQGREEGCDERTGRHRNCPHPCHHSRRSEEEEQEEAMLHRGRRRTMRGSRSPSREMDSEKEVNKAQQDGVANSVHHRRDGSGDDHARVNPIRLPSGLPSHHPSGLLDGLSDSSALDNANNSRGNSMHVNTSTTANTTLMNNSNHTGEAAGTAKVVLPSLLRYCDGISFNPMAPQTRQTEGGIEVVYSCCDHDSVCVDLVKFVGFFSEDDAPADELAEMAEAQVRAAAAKGLTALRRSHEQAAKEMWKVADIRMIGVDSALRGAYRFNILQVLMNTTPSPLYGFPTRINLPCTAAGALAGQIPFAAAGGSHSWEVEAIIIPFLSHVCPERARNLLEFRCRHLHDARLNAQDMELRRGAWYPYRTITGSDSEVPFVAFLFVNAVIAYAMRKYVTITNDFSILFKDGGAEVIVASALVYLEWGTWDRGSFHLRAVSGPDTMSGSVNNNFFTNCMVQEHLEWAVQIASVCRANDMEFWKDLMTRNAMEEEDVEAMEKAAKHIVLTFDARHRVQVMDEHFLKRKRWVPRDGSGYVGGGPSLPWPRPRSVSGGRLTSTRPNTPTATPPLTSSQPQSFSGLLHAPKASRTSSEDHFSPMYQEMTMSFDAASAAPPRHACLQRKLSQGLCTPAQELPQKGACMGANGKHPVRSQRMETSSSLSPSNGPTLEVNHAGSLSSSASSSSSPDRRLTPGIPSCFSSPPSLYNSSLGSGGSYSPSYLKKRRGGCVRPYGVAHPHINRYQLCSLPDVVLACMLLPENFTKDEIQANFEYYAPITVDWGSPLRLGIFSVVAAQLHLPELSGRYFRHALHTNLRTPPTISGVHDEGIDGASAAMAWWTVGVGFSGMRVIHGVLHFSPMMPGSGEGFQFICRHNGFLVQLKVQSPGKVEYLLLQGPGPTRPHATQPSSSGITTPAEREDAGGAEARNGGRAVGGGGGNANTIRDGSGSKENPQKEKDGESVNAGFARSLSAPPTVSTNPSTSSVPLSVEEELWIVHAGAHRILLRCGVPETVTLVC